MHDYDLSKALKIMELSLKTTISFYPRQEHRVLLIFRAETDVVMVNSSASESEFNFEIKPC